MIAPLYSKHLSLYSLTSHCEMAAVCTTHVARVLRKRNTKRYVKTWLVGHIMKHHFRLVGLQKGLQKNIRLISCMHLFVKFLLYTFLFLPIKLTTLSFWVHINSNSGVILRAKGQRSWPLGMKMWKSFFSLIYPSKVDRLTSNQDQNDRRPILHISPDTFHQWTVEMLRLCDDSCL